MKYFFALINLKRNTICLLSSLFLITFGLLISPLASAESNTDFAVMDDGATYMITIPYNNKTLDVPGKSKKPNQHIHQWHQHKGRNQLFTFEPVGNGYFFIKNVNSQLVLEVHNESKGNDAKIVQNRKHGRASQQFGFIEIGRDTYIIMNRNSGKVLDVDGASKENGAFLIQDTNCERRNQQFKIVKTADPLDVDLAKIDHQSTYIITALHSNKVLDVPGHSKEQSVQIHQWTRHNRPNQQFTFKPAGDGYYFIQNVNSNLVLSVFRASKEEDAKIVQQRNHGGTNQQFGFIQTAPDTYIIMNRNSGKIFDVVSRSMDNGAKLIQDPDRNGKNQRFKLVKLAAPSDCGGEWKTIAHEGRRLQFSGTRLVRYGAKGKYVTKKVQSGTLCNNATFGDPIAVPKACSICENSILKLAKIDYRATYIIEIPYNNKVLDVPAGSLEPNVHMQQWDRHGKPSQQFTFEPADDGYYFIRNVRSNLFLEVLSSSKAEEAGIMQERKHGGTSQQFGLISVGRWTYFIINRNSGKVLDVLDGSMKNSGFIVQNTNHKRKSQTFRLAKLVPTPCDDGIFGQWNIVAQEGQTLQFVDTQFVRYGANDKYVVKEVPPGTKCANAAFGDPIPGVRKTCSTCGAVPSLPPPRR